VPARRGRRGGRVIRIRVVPARAGVRAAAMQRGAARTAGTGRAQLVQGQLPVAVGVEGQQRGGRVRNFGGIEDAVVVRVEDLDEGRCLGWPGASGAGVGGVLGDGCEG